MSADSLDPVPICFDCGAPIRGTVVWLGESYPNDEKDYPFHPTCAFGAWPLHELRRTRTVADLVREIG